MTIENKSPKTSGRVATPTSPMSAAGAAWWPANSWPGWPLPRSRWLDVGCGTGALASTILDTARRHARARASIRPTASSPTRAATSRSARQLRGRRCAGPCRLGTRGFDAAVSGLVLNFVPDQPAAVAEMQRRRARAAPSRLYVWDYAGEMQMMRHFWDAAVGARSRGGNSTRAARFPICQPEPLERCSAPRASGRGGARHRRPDRLPRLRRLLDAVPRRPGAGARLRHVLERGPPRRAPRASARTLPIERDGSIHLIARAWAVRGVKA